MNSSFFRSLLHILIITGTCWLGSCNTKEDKPSTSTVFTNDQFIEGLYTDIRPDSPKEVFHHIFHSLPDEVTIYPSENVYYFKSPILGKHYEGTITLYPLDRDSGRLGFGYINRMEDRRMQKYFAMNGGSHDFTEKDGLLISKKNNNQYAVSYKNKQVLFNLHVLPDTMAASLLLKPEEQWVTSTFDESGLQFHIVFNKQVNKLYWVLNEAVFVPESFRPISKNLYIGDRTEFVFYQDTARKRKILVGVNGENVMQNNWYDGPFDHLADNRVAAGKLNMKQFLEKHLPDYHDKIDNYGHYINRKGTRVALAPYTVYFELQELSFIDSLQKNMTDENQFFEMITEQNYEVPDSYYDFSESYIRPQQLYNKSRENKKSEYKIFQWVPGRQKSNSTK
jgi:hypothetical protein